MKEIEILFLVDIYKNMPQVTFSFLYLWKILPCVFEYTKGKKTPYLGRIPMFFENSLGFLPPPSLSCSHTTVINRRSCSKDRTSSLTAFICHRLLLAWRYSHHDRAWCVINTVIISSLASNLALMY